MATFNFTDFPIKLTNLGTITERWAIVFTSPTEFKVIGEHVGQIGTGNTGTNCAPKNVNTNVPYWEIDYFGFGAGWAAGNVLRFNTIAAQGPIWGVRTVQQGPSSAKDDGAEIWILGSVDKE